jgi:hypothetical protein
MDGAAALEHRPPSGEPRGGPATSVAAAARTAVGREPGLVTVGAVGLGLAALCLVAAAVRGRFIPPEGKMLDAATFCFGVGVFTLTISLLLPVAGYNSSTRRRWRRAFYVFTVYGLALESIQAFRGLDPRFTEAGGPLDVGAGIIFGFTALLHTILFVLIGLQFFRSDVLSDRRELRLGVRYAAVAVALSFAVGIVMSINSGRQIGDDGNLLLSHGLGVHGIQALPVAALLFAVGTRAAPTWLHAAGIGWLAACTAALAQALLGHPPLEASLVTGLIVAGLAVWTTAVGAAVISRRRAGRPRSVGR